MQPTYAYVFMLDDAIRRHRCLETDDKLDLDELALPLGDWLWDDVAGEEEILCRVYCLASILHPAAGGELMRTLEEDWGEWSGIATRHPAGSHNRAFAASLRRLLDLFRHPAPDEVSSEQ